MRIGRLLGTAAVAALLAVSALGAPSVRAADSKDIVDTAVGAGSFKTLAAALKAADLVSTLKGAGPFTVFAPTDEAFERLEKSKPGILATLLKPENREKLAGILTYHVVPGKVMAADAVRLGDGTKVKTVNGKSFTLRTKGGVRVDRARVIKTDINCSNGVIHVIDSVIVPE